MKTDDRETLLFGHATLRDWFAATERYPRQLHELEQDEYLVMKRKEYQRQQVIPWLPSTFPKEVAHVQDAGTG